MKKKLELPPEVLDLFKAFVIEPKGFLMFAGNASTGKTFAAESILQNLINRFNNYPQQAKLLYAKSITAQDHFQLHLVSDIQKDWFAVSNKPDEYANYLRKIRSLKVLVIDDLGRRTPTEPFLDILHNIIDWRLRMQDSMGTIFTTNLNEKKLTEVYGEPIATRLFTATQIIFDGPSRRPRGPVFKASGAK